MVLLPICSECPGSQAQAWGGKQDLASLMAGTRSLGLSESPLSLLSGQDSSGAGDAAGGAHGTPFSAQNDQDASPKRNFMCYAAPMAWHTPLRSQKDKLPSKGRRRRGEFGSEYATPMTSSLFPAPLAASLVQPAPRTPSPRSQLSPSPSPSP